MRLSIAGARAAAIAWLRTRDLPPLKYVTQRGYDAEKNGRRHVVMLPVEKLNTTIPLIEFLVHDDGSVTVVSDSSIQVLNELLSQGVNAYRMPGILDHKGAFNLFIASLQMCRDVPEWFVSLDICESTWPGAEYDAYANVRRDEDHVMSVPVKVLPTRDQKRTHMRQLSSRITCRMIAMDVNRHRTGETIATKFFARLTNMRQVYLNEKI